MSLNVPPLITEILEKAKSLFLEGTIALESGDLSNSEAKLLECLNLIPDRESTLQNLAIVFTLKADRFSDKGEKNEALVAYNRALIYNPNLAIALSNKGVLLNNEFSLVDAAIACFKKALQISPNFADAYLNLGTCYAKLGEHEKAIEYFDLGISIDPNLSEAWINRGKALQVLKLNEEALTSYEVAIRINPTEAEVWSHQAEVLNQLQRYEDALASYDKTLELQPNWAAVWNDRSVLLNDLKRHNEALTSCDRAIELKPDLAEAWVNRANVFSDLMKYAEVLSNLERAIEIKPEDPEVWVNRGLALNELNQREEAIASFEQALKLNPDIDHALGELVHTQMNICDWSDLEQRCMRLEQRLRAGDKASDPFPVLGLFDDPQLHKLTAQLYVKKKLSAVSPLGAIPPRRPGGKIRVAYFSMDFREHPVSLLMADLIECHDRNAFEIYGFSFGPNTNDAMRKRLEKAFDKFIDVRDSSDLDIARLAREHSIDIAVDLGGHTKGSRPQIFAHRAAPVQINYLGYPGTMGTEHLDYFIADSITVEPQDCEHFSEKIIFLPNSFQANPSRRPSRSRRGSRAEFGLPQSGFVFCCFNNTYKITPDVFESWARILNQVQNSVLWLSQNHPSATANLLKMLESRQIAASRIVFAGRLPDMADHLARYQSVDLFLDTSPYGAHTTASDALWAGLPVLTRCGQSFASRVASSLLHAVGLPELVTDSSEAYEALAIDLSLNPHRLKALKDKLQINRLSTPLFDNNLFTHYIESAYKTVHQRHIDDLVPDHIYLYD